MADFDGSFDLMLTTQRGDAGDRFTLPDQSANLAAGLILPVDIYTPYDLPTEIFGSYISVVIFLTPASYAGAKDPSPGFYWFERVHVSPIRLDLGNILSVIIKTIEIYNAYRLSSRVLEDAINNAGVGVDFIGLPSLPFLIASQHSLIIAVQISTQGPPDINGTLDFDLDIEDISVPITGTRIVIFPYIPEDRIREMLEHKTDILVSVNGKEQRRSIRKHPRQSFRFDVKVEEGPERRRLANLLFGFQSGTFGVPVWFEGRYLAADVTAGADTISVSTDYADFRVASLAIVWVDSTYFDVLEIESFDATSITFTSPLVNSYTAGRAIVMPVRVAITDTRSDRARAIRELDIWSLDFLVVDNEADIGSTAAFDIHDNKVMLEEPNLMEGDTIVDGYLKKRERQDNLSGSVIQFSDWVVPNVVTRKGFLAHDARRVWEVRQLFHALRGSQVSFYLSTFGYDLIPVNPLVQSSFILDVEHVGYSDFVNAQNPLQSIRIELVDGTILTRKVISATEFSSTIERLTVDVMWAKTIQVADIAKISYLRLCRIVEDKMEFEHIHVGTARIFVGVLGVQQ
jgi:predicted CoA-binding protein